MNLAPVTLLWPLLIILMFFVGIPLLQIFLSRRNNRIAGLILPFVTFLYSIVCVLSVVGINSMTVWHIVATLILTFLVANVPTLILLAIYFACKEKEKRKKQLEKMNIQDLN